MTFKVTFASGQTMLVHAESEAGAREHAAAMVQNGRSKHATRGEEEYRDAGAVTSVEPE